MSTFTLTRYDVDGDQISSQSVSVDELEKDALALFAKKLSRLSGDLELPLEAKLPGKFPQIDYRIGSDGYGAYVLYYLNDEVVFASLLLRGEDESCEIELTQVFKFLLLDTNDQEEPTEEEIEEVLASPAFDFETITARPAAFTIRFSDLPDEEAELQHIESMDRHLAAVFLGLVAVD